MRLPQRSTIITNVELFQEDLARLYHTVQFAFDQTPAATEGALQATFAEERFAAGSLDAFFANPALPPVLDNFLLRVDACPPATKRITVDASSGGVYLQVEGGDEFWNQGLFAQVRAVLTSAQRPPVVFPPPRWRGLVYGLFLLVEVLTSGWGIVVVRTTGQPLVLINGVAGGVTIGYLAYLSSKWTTEDAAVRRRPQPGRIALARRPRPASRGRRREDPPLRREGGLRLIGALTAGSAVAGALATMAWPHL